MVGIQYHYATPTRQHATGQSSSCHRTSKQHTRYTPYGAPAAPPPTPRSARPPSPFTPRKLVANIISFFSPGSSSSSSDSPRTPGTPDQLFAAGGSLYPGHIPGEWRGNTPPPADCYFDNDFTLPQPQVKTEPKEEEIEEEIEDVLPRSPSPTPQPPQPRPRRKTRARREPQSQPHPRSEPLVQLEPQSSPQPQPVSQPRRAQPQLRATSANSEAISSRSSGRTSKHWRALSPRPDSIFLECDRGRFELDSDNQHFELVYALVKRLEAEEQRKREREREEFRRLEQEVEESNRHRELEKQRRTPPLRIGRMTKGARERMRITDLHQARMKDELMQREFAEELRKLRMSSADP